MLAFAAPAVGQPILYPTYLLGDLASLALPAVLFAAGHRSRSFLAEPSTLVALGAAAFLAAALGPFFADEWGRFEPPTPLVIGFAWVWLYSARTHRGRMLAALLIVALLMLGFASGYRTSVVLVGLGGAVAAFVCRRWTLTVVGLIFAALAAAIWAPELADKVYDVLLDSRFRRMMNFELDESLRLRFLEAVDVFSTIDKEWTGPTYVMGYGHGATYVPVEAVIEPNLTVHDRVHNIHITPVMILFRYGLIGAFAYLFAVGRLAGELVRARRIQMSLPYAAYLVATALFAADSIARNSLVDPAFSFCVAGLLFTRRAPKES